MSPLRLSALSSCLSVSYDLIFSGCVFSLRSLPLFYFAGSLFWLSGVCQLSPFSFPLCIFLLGLLEKITPNSGGFNNTDSASLLSGDLKSEVKASAGLVPSGGCRETLFHASLPTSGVSWPPLAFLGLQKHHLRLCIHSHLAVSLLLCVCVQMSPFYKDTGHSGLRSHPAPVGPHLNLTNYICKDPPWN